MAKWKKKRTTKFCLSVSQSMITNSDERLTFERGKEEHMHNNPMMAMQKLQSQYAVSPAFAKVA